MQVTGSGQLYRSSSQVISSYKFVFFSLKVVFVLANSVDTALCGIQSRSSLFAKNKTFSSLPYTKGQTISEYIA